MDGGISSCKMWIMLHILTCLIIRIVAANAKVKGTFKCTPVRHKVITCSTTNLPSITNGSFDCAPNTDVSMGETCALSCNDGFYAANSNQVVCETGTSEQEGKWSEGSFLCHEITCSTNNLPIIGKGSFDCAPNTNISKGEACYLTCNDGFYPAYSSQAVCEKGIPNQERVWSDGSFVCHECNDWNEWNGSEYKYITTGKTWQESRQLCESENSHLVTIQNKEENEFIHKMVQHCNQFYNQYSDMVWIGLNFLNTEGTWEWTDGTVSLYRNWSEGQPDGGGANDFVRINRVDGEWHDGTGTRKRPAVCERNSHLT